MRRPNVENASISAFVPSAMLTTSGKNRSRDTFSCYLIAVAGNLASKRCPIRPHAELGAGVELAWLTRIGKRENTPFARHGRAAAVARPLRRRSGVELTAVEGARRVAHPAGGQGRRQLLDGVSPVEDLRLEDAADGGGAAEALVEGLEELDAALTRRRVQPFRREEALASANGFKPGKSPRSANTTRDRAMRCLGHGSGEAKGSQRVISSQRAFSACMCWVARSFSWEGRFSRATGKGISALKLTF